MYDTSCLLCKCFFVFGIVSLKPLACIFSTKPLYSIPSKAHMKLKMLIIGDMLFFRKVKSDWLLPPIASKTFCSSLSPKTRNSCSFVCITGFSLHGLWLQSFYFAFVFCVWLRVYFLSQLCISKLPVCSKKNKRWN